MLLYGKPGIIFKCEDLSCLLNDTFNVILFTNYSAVQGTDAHSVGFIVPVKYLDFIKTISLKNTFETKVTDIFIFEKSEHIQKLQAFILKENKEMCYRIIPDLFPLKSVKRR